MQKYRTLQDKEKNTGHYRKYRTATRTAILYSLDIRNMELGHSGPNQQVSNPRVYTPTCRGIKQYKAIAMVDLDLLVHSGSNQGM